MADRQVILKLKADEYGIIAFDLRKYSLDISKDYEVAVRIWRRSRSNNQNRYYRGCVVREIASHTGYTDDEVHEILKHLFLLKDVIINGQTFTIARSTTELNTVEFEEYLKKCRDWASSELKIYIGFPNEYPEFCSYET